ncbi:MAG: DNA-protecting protein DprA, partial [Chloroflexota bacterium]|nr:DNA-protecting protein DprA [Chloroflexota bacterium]
SLDFTRQVAQHLAEHSANVISGNARGVDRTAYEGATSTEAGCTTVILPHGIRKLSGVQMRNFLPKIESEHVLLLSQFHPDAQWVVSRAMERNKVVTGLSQIVIVAESNTKGGTWEGANSALTQKRAVYVRQSSEEKLSGNEALIEQGGQPLIWPPASIANMLTPLLYESAVVQEKQSGILPQEEQLTLFMGVDNKL